MDVITTHINADFDGLASMVAGRKLYPSALLILPGGAQEAVRGFLAAHDLGLTRLKDIDQSKIRRLILMDTQDPDRIGPLKAAYLNSAVSIHIYDHHPPFEQAAQERTKARLDRLIIEPVGSTTAILIEQLQAQNLSLTPSEATVLALGLYEETGSFAYASTTSRDFHAAAYVLGAGADLNVVTDTLRRHLNPELITLLNELVDSRETFDLSGRTALLAASTYDQYRGDLAEAVHKLAEMEGYDAIIAVFAMDGRVEVIARSRCPEIDVGRLMQEFGGGGHATAAAATVKGRTVIEIKEHAARLLTGQSRPPLLAREIMTSPAITIDDHATVGDAETVMTKYSVNAVPVVTGTRRYRGMITRETIQKGLFHRLGHSPVTDFMQSETYTATPATPFHDIETQMFERNQRLVPILVSGRPVGVITRTDLLRALHEAVAAARPGVGREAPAREGRNLAGLMRGRLPARVFDLLQHAGKLAEAEKVHAFVVGGFVRDLLLDRANLDVDLVVEGDGIAYAYRLAREWKATVKTHVRFGTAVLGLADGFKIDVATARTEYYAYPTALPTVERSSIKKDLFRRDFTINALAIRLDAGQFGELLDFYGGRRDLHEKTIRVLHSLSFVEDPTRILRAVRFEQRFHFRLAKETLALIKSAVKMNLFHRLSGSRFLEELILLLSDEEPSKALLRLSELDLLQSIHPQLRRLSKLEGLLKSVDESLDWYRLLYLDRPMEAWVVYFLVLMELLPEQAARETIQRLPLPKRQEAAIRTGRFRSADLQRRLGRRPSPRPSEPYRLLKGMPDEVLLFIMAKTKSESVKRQISSYVTVYQHVKPILTGDDLKSMGINPGPVYSDILDRLLDARLDGEITTEGEERELVKRLVGE